MVDNPLIVQTSRLRIRKLTPTDASFILTLVNDPDWLLHIGDRNIHTLSQAQDFITDGPIHSYQQNGFGMYVFEDASKLTPMGLCGLLQRDFLSAPDIGYATLPQYRRAGFTVEACQAVIAHDMQAFRIEQLFAMISPENSASVKLIESLGFAFSKNIERDGVASLLYLRS